MRNSDGGENERVGKRMQREIVGKQTRIQDYERGNEQRKGRRN